MYMIVIFFFPIATPPTVEEILDKMNYELVMSLTVEAPVSNNCLIFYYYLYTMSSPSFSYSCSSSSEKRNKTRGKMAVRKLAVRHQLSRGHFFYLTLFCFSLVGLRKEGFVVCLVFTGHYKCFGFGFMTLN